MGMLMRAMTVLATVLASAVVVGATSTPAAGAGGLPPQCTMGTGLGQTVEVEQYPAARIADLDVRVPWGYESRSTLVLVNGQPGPYQWWRRWVLSDSAIPFSGYYGAVIFDNEAALGPGEPIPSGSEVRVRPEQPLPRDYVSDERTWYVEMNGEPFPSRHFDIIVTYSDCDEDSDAVGDRTRDNCVGTHNPDQRDLDGDRAGDACDADDDGDGVVDASDNCPWAVNADQTDWDGDRVGNACDGTPGAAPVAPTPTTTPTTSPVPPTTGCTNGCAYVRTVELRHRAKRHRFQGAVASVAQGCRSEVPVTIWRKRSGADRKLVVVTTRGSGAFRTRAPRAAGRYYATVGSAAEPLCGTDRSRVVRIRRR